MNVGIDLGTTFSSIAICEEEFDRPMVTEFDLSSHAGSGGETKLPSVVYVKPDGATVVGKAALNFLATAPERVFQCFKRQMGEEEPLGTLDGVDWTPPKLSAEILKILKAAAESSWEETINGAVVCVPAWFGDRQRAATIEALGLAGFPEDGCRLMAEPSAAALAVAMRNAEHVAGKDVLVYDLGGGTFDVVLVRTRPGENGRLEVESLCREGHFQLGGHDWDQALAAYLSQRCSEEHGHNPKTSEDKREWLTTLERVESSKRDYGTLESISIPVGLRGHAFEVSLEEFNRITDKHLQDTRKWVEKVLEEGEREHGVKRDKLVVILCGGSSRLPAVKPMLTELIGHPPLDLKKKSNPERLVVWGAAYAAFLQDQESAAATEPRAETEEAGKTDVFQDRYRAVGVKEYAGTNEAGEDQYRNCVVVPEGAKQEEKHSKQFQTAEEGATELTITVLQGSEPDPDKCERIGSLHLTDLPPGRKEGTGLTVDLWYDKSGILQGRVVDESGKEGHFAVER